MACQLHCPNCGEDLGKDTENAKSAYCSNCGEDKIYNERGYNADGSNDNDYPEKVAWSAPVRRGRIF